MKLPNFYEFDVLNILKSKMGISHQIYGKLEIKISPILTELELEKITSVNGLDIDPSDLVVSGDGTLSYKQTRVLLYIRDISILGNNTANPKFHISNCSTLQKMRALQKFNRYVVSIQTNGFFSVNRINGNKTEATTCKLDVCQNCLSLLSFDGFGMHWSQNSRQAYVSSFSISKFFEKYPQSLHTSTPLYNSGNSPENKYTEDFNKISNHIRESHNWTCVKCKVNLSKNKKWLHVHHKNSMKYDNTEGNLVVLCIKCHANEPNHNHIKQLPAYNEFLKYYA